MTRLCVFPLGANRYDYGRRDHSIHVRATYAKPKREQNFGLFRER